MQIKLYLFFFTHFTYGLIFTLFGPLIPYLAEDTNLSQSQFTYIFAMRGISYLIAGLSQKTILKEFCLYKRMLISCLFSGLGFFLFQLSYFNPTILAIVSFLMNLCNGSIQVLINVLLMDEVKDNPKQVMGFSYGVYGIGAVVGPVVVSMYGVDSLKISAFWMIILTLLYAYLIFIKKTTTSQTQLQTPLSKELQKQPNIMNEHTQKKFCFLFLLYAAITLSYRSWLPSFIVMQGISSKENAAMSISIYSAVLTGFRFMFTYLNPDTLVCLNYVSYAMIGVVFMSILCYWLQFYFLMVFGSAILMGILFASYVPYLYALPSKFNKTFTPNNTFNTVIYYSIGQAVVSALIGYLMQWIHNLMLFFSLFILCICNKSLLSSTIKSLKKQKQSQKTRYQKKCIELQNF